MGKFVAASFGAFLAAAGQAFAQQQGDVAAQCSGVSGKVFACCQRVVTAHPNITQCDKERGVFQCVGAKRYESRNGCGTFLRDRRAPGRVRVLPPA